MKKKGEKKKEKKSEKKTEKKTEKNKPSEKKKQRKEEIKQKTIENKTKEKKFIMSAPVITKVKYQGIPIKKINIRPQSKNTSIQEANKFIDSVISSLFQQSKDSNKLIQITYKLSNDKWYSSKFFGSANENYYPDVESQYGIDASKEAIEHINITIKTKNPLKK